MDYVALKSEFTTDPQSLGYAAPWGTGDDTLLASIINTGRYAGPISIVTLSAYCLGANITGAIEAALDTGTLPGGGAMTFAQRAACRQMLTLVKTDYRLTTADVSDPKFGAGCDALVAAGLMTAQNKTDMLNLGAAARSRAAQLFGDGTVVGTDDVAKARRS